MTKIRRNLDLSDKSKGVTIDTKPVGEYVLIVAFLLLLTIFVIYSAWTRILLVYL